MDRIGQITDPALRIFPSRKLQKYLATLENSNGMPSGILKFLDNQPKDVKPQDDAPIVSDYLLNEDDLSILKSLQPKSDAFEGKLKKSKNSSSNEQLNGERSVENFLTLTDLDWLYVHLEKDRKTGSDSYFHELFEGSEVLLPDNEVLKRNPKLEARCVKLRNQQLSREYKAMTKSVDNVRAMLPEDTIAYQVKQINKQMIEVAQFVMSMAAGFLFGFLGINLMVGPLDFGFRLLLGVMFSLIIKLAEIYFLAKKLNYDLNVTEPQQIGGPPLPQGVKKLHQD